MTASLLARRVFGDELERIIHCGRTQWETPVAQEMRELDRVDFESLWVASRTDWSTVDHSLEARMHRGVRYLRHYYPLGAVHINPKTLDIADSNMCVMGQLWGAFDHSIENRLLGPAFCSAHGLMGAWVKAHRIGDDERALTAAWARELWRLRGMEHQ